MPIVSCSSRVAGLVDLRMLAVITGLLVNAAANSAAIQFQEVSAQAGFNKITTSYGASWGDVNGDGWPDLFANNHARRNSIYVNNGDGTFTDAALTLDVNNFWSGAGAWEDTHGGSWADYDNDGDQDLLISTGNCCDPQFLENENGKLYYRSIEKGFGGNIDAGGRMPIWFDIDDDGLLETIIMSFYPAPLMQQAGASFNKLPWATMACKDNQFANLIDTDADGHLDIICVHKGAKFSQAAYDFSSAPFINFQASLPDISSVNELITGDFDGDLRTDMLLLKGSLRPSEVKVFDGDSIEAMFVNGNKSFSFKSPGTVSIVLDWDKTFTNFSNIWIGANGGHPNSESLVLNPADAAVQGVKPYSPKSYPEIYIGYEAATQTWHVNTYSDEWMTAYFEVESTAPITNMIATGIKSIDKPVRPVMLKNEPSGFVDVTQASGLNVPMWCVGGTSGDFDNDGDLDIYLVCRGGVQNIENRMYENDGNGNFTLVPNEGGAKSVTGIAVKHKNGTGEGVVSADYDVDGRLDLFVMNGLNMWPHFRNGGPDQMFRNVAPARNWVQLDLVGDPSNRDGIGAIVYATANGSTQLREQNGGYHRWAQDHQRLHFGLGDSTTVDLEVQWPSGLVDTYTGVASNKLYRVLENEAIEEVVLDGSGGGGDPDDPECFAPNYDPAAEQGLFVWSDCDGSGSWHVRGSAGGSPSLVSYIGDISSNNDFVSATEVSFESGDVIDIISNTKQAQFSLNMLRSGQDGFDFVLPEGSDACLDVAAAPTGDTVKLGVGKVPLDAPIDLNTLEACTGAPPPPPPPGECGEPPFNPAADGAILIYKDCGADNWHVRAASASGYVRYRGSIVADEAIQGFAGVSIEAADDVNNDVATEISYDMRLANPWFDGFDFTLSCSANATFTLDTPAGATVLVGSGRSPAPATFNLSELPLCSL